MRRLALLALSLLAATAVFAQTKAATGKGAPKISKGERDAVQALLQAQTGSPDDRIKAAENLITKYNDTPYKTFALFQEAQAYSENGDNTKAIVYCENALDADPKYYDAEQLMANLIANSIHENDLDKADRIAKATKAANDAIEQVKAAEKPVLFQVNDEQWEKLRNEVEAESWQALGTLALVQKKTSEAVENYEKGLALSPDPLIMMRAGRALLAAGKPDDAIGMFDKAEASPDASPQLKQIAENDKKRALSLKK